MKTITLVPETHQEAFDRVIRKIDEQNDYSFVGNTCMYEGVGGLRCAVAHMFPDVPEIREAAREIDSHVDDRTFPVDIESLVDAGHVIASGIDVNFLTEMQDAHDFAADAGNKNPGKRIEAFFYQWVESLYTIADDYELDVSELDAMCIKRKMRV